MCTIALSDVFTVAIIVVFLLLQLLLLLLPRVVEVAVTTTTTLFPIRVATAPPATPAASATPAVTEASTAFALFSLSLASGCLSRQEEGKDTVVRGGIRSLLRHRALHAGDESDASAQQTSTAVDGSKTSGAGGAANFRTSTIDGSCAVGVTGVFRV